MSTELVLQDLAADEHKLLKCITAHPGFNAVCLKKWSLRLAADKYRTKGKQKYRQTGSEEKKYFPCSISLAREPGIYKNHNPLHKPQTMLIIRSI